MKKFFHIFSILLAFSFTAYAQENCNDGIDNDGDGLIDCNDPDCQFPPTEEQGCNCEDGIDNDGDGKTDVFDPKCASYYGLTFVGDASDCSITPPSFGDPFASISDDPAVSGQNTVDTQSKLAIGDVDGDGIPDVVATTKWNQQIRLIATTDGQADGSDAGDIKASWKTTDPSVGNILKASGSTFYFDLETLIADIDRDGTAELFATVYRRDNSTKQILAYFIGRWDYDGTKDLVNIWAVNLGTQRPGIPGIADFDGDGRGEIYLKNHIYDAHTGTLLASAPGDWNTEVNAAPVAVNMMGDARLELVSGKNIYTVGGSPVNSLTLAMDMNTLGQAQYFPKVLNDVFEYGITNFSSTSVADFDDDGNIDVFLSGAVGSTAGHTAIFYWNVAKGTVGTFLPTHPDTGIPPSVVSYPNGWPWGTGRVNLGELDGDGLLEANFISGNQLYALEEGAAGTLVQLWAGPKTLNDFRSGVVSTTVYDFDNDGTFELVYRDTQVLSVIDGATGTTTHWSTSCQSHTMTEGPIIADINGDGSTDICVPCFTGPGKFKLDGDLAQQALGEIRIFFSDEDAWLPTRKVYNQPGYFVVNINDDLTLPFPQLGQALQFGTGPCANGVPGPQQPLNTFLNQVPTIDANGCPVYPGPDIAFVGNDPTLQPGDPGYVDPSDPNYFPSVEVIPPTCGDLAIIVNFNIINDGLRAITSDIPTSFWDGDPSIDPTATLLHTELLPVANFGIGDTLSYGGVTFNSTGKAFTLYVVLNDDGSSVPPITIGGAIEECKLGNNIVAFPITPEPFTVQLEIIQDNNKCVDTAPDNGEIRAIVFENGLEAPDLSKYGFQWYAGADTTAAVVPDPVGSLDRITGMAEGSYTVVVTNLAKGCTSLPVDTAIVRIGVDPIINIIERSPQSQCTPFNGELEVQIVGGNAGFTFEWFKGAAFVPMGVTSSVLSNLEKDDYVVRVTKDGCSKTASHALSGPVFPDAVATTLSNVIDCANLNSGVIDADASIAGVIQDPAGYTFTWYHWDDVTSTLGAQIASSFGTGKTRTGLPVGWYAVVVKSTTTNCESFPPVATEVIDQTQIPTVILSELQFNSSCDPLNPNGQLQVAIDLGGIAQDPALYTIEWFVGDNTSPVNQILTTGGVNGEIVTGVGIAGAPYTVSVSSALNCATTDTLSVSQNIIVPAISGLAINNAICNPALASGNPFNGSVNSSVTFNGVPVTPAELTANYTFVWYDGTDISTDPVIPGETNASLLNLDAGFYSVTISLDSVGCTSTPITVEVQDIPTLPTILITETPETTCGGTPNGSLAAAVDIGGVPVIAGYTYEWYVGIGTGGALVGVTSGTESEIALELNGGQDYTVRIINDATGCESQLSYFLNDISSNPVVTLVKVDNGICDAGIGFVGSVTAVVTDLNGSNDYLNDYTFTWYTGNTATPGNEIADPDLATPLTLEALEGNFYTLVISNDVLGCTSLPVNIEVVDIPPVIDIIITENVPSTNCAAAANGILAAAVDSGGVPVTAGYTFTWYAGTNPATDPLTNTDGNDFRAIDLQGGAGMNYTVKVVENGSGCEEILTILLNNNSQIPIVTLTTSANTVCDPAFAGVPNDGAVTATVADPNGSLDFVNDYTLLWTDATMTPVADGDPLTPLVLDNVPGGDYNLLLTNDILGCTALLVTTTVNDNPLIIDIGTVAIASINCSGTGNGSIQAYVDANTNGVLDAGEDDIVNFTYEWYVGLGTGGANTAIQAGSPNIAIDLQGGAGNNYTVRIIDNASGCDNTFSVLLGDNSQIPIVTLTPADNSICDPLIAGIPYNGTVTATVTDPNGSLDFANDYTFLWTDAAMVPVVDGDPLTPLVLDNVPGGVYFLLLTNDVLGCNALLVNTTVNENPLIIDIGTVNLASTNCAGTGNGSIQAYVDVNTNGVLDAGEDDIVNFTYEWYVGLVTGGANTATQAGSPNIAIDLQGGAANNYTVRVIDNASGCDNTLSVLLNDAQELPVVTLTSTDNKGCTVGNYTGTVTALVMYQGIDVTASGDYTFTWTSSDGAFVSVDAATITNLKGSETYLLSATNNILGCTAPDVITTVNDNPEPIVVFFGNTINTSCAAAGNGEIIGAIDTNGNGNYDPGIDDDLANLGDYTFTWHVGNTPTGIPPASIIAANHINLLDGNEFITLVVEQTSTGCITSHTEFVQKIITVPDVTVTATDYNTCATDVMINVVINNIADFSPGDPVNDFVYTWYRGTDDSGVALNPADIQVNLNGTADGVVLTMIDLGAGLVELPAEDYAVVVEHINSTCTANVQTDRIDGPIAPLFTIVEGMPTPASVCKATDGSFPVSIVEAGSYSFEWYEGVPTNPPSAPPASFYTDPSITFAAGPIAGQNTATLTGVADGTYTVVVTDDALGCKEYLSVYVPFLDNQVVGSTIVRHILTCPPANIGEIDVIISNLVGLPVPGDDARNYIYELYNKANPVVGIDPVFDTQIPAGAALGVTFSNLGEGNYTVVIIQNFGGVLGCVSETKLVTIENWAYEPIVSLTGSVNPNTSCDLPGNADGSLTINVQHHPDEQWAGTVADPEPTFTIIALAADGAKGNDVNLGNGLSTGNHTISGLGPTDYSISILSSRGCATIRTFTVPDEPLVTEVITSNISHTDTCIPVNGTMDVITIAQAGTGLPFNTDDFQFYWTFDANLDGVFNDAVVYVEAGNGPGDGTQFDNGDAGFAGPGTYWVEISANPGAGAGLNCPSAPFQFILLDQTADPAFAYDVTANTTCVGAPDGTLFIDPDRSGAIPIFTGWTIDFITVPAGSGLGAGNALALEGDTFSAIGQPDGTYDFIITDDATGCSVNGSLIISTNPVTPVLNNAGYNIVNQFICNPDGSITITQIETIVSGIPGNPATAPTTSIDVNMANYTFKWYVGSVAPANELAGVIDNVLDNNDAGFIGAGTYWLEVTKVAANPGEGGIGCESVPYEFEILDQSVEPTFVYNVTANTSCVGGPDGTLFIDPDRNGAIAAFTGWTIDFTSVPVGSLLGLGNTLPLEGNTFSATGQPDGSYSFTITDDVTGCSTSGALMISTNPVTPVLNNAGYTVIDQFICGPDGSITITQLETVVSGLPGNPPTSPTTNTDVNMANYSFTWYLGSVAFANIVGDNNNVLDNTDLGFIGAATYLVEVSKIATNPGEGGVGCTSSPYQFEITDQSVDPIFTYSVTSNTACGPAGADGSVTITPNANGATVPLTTWTYTFAGPSPIPVTTNALASTQFTNLLPGDYTFTLSYDNSNCGTSGSFNIPDNPITPLLLDPDPFVIHQLTCNTGGSITVTSVTTIESVTMNSVLDVTLSNYEFIWYVGDDFSSAVQTYTDIGLSGSNGHIYDILDPGFVGAGTYWLEIRKINTNPGDGGLGCTSAPYKIIIEDQSIDPVIAFSQTSNTACNLAQADGSITAAATTSGVSIPAVTSVFIWYKGPDSSSPLFVDGVDGTIDQAFAGEETLRGVAPGVYTVNITDGNTGCSIEGSFEVRDQPVIPDLNLDNALFVDQTVCSPSGSITVSGTDIRVGGIVLAPGDEFDFIFTWRYEDPTSAPLDSANAGVSTGLPIQGPSIDSTVYLAMGSGTYYVTITSKTGIGAGCTGPPVSKVLNDISVDPQLSFITTANSSCDLVTPNGSIAAIAQEADGSFDSYSFVWSYTGTGVIPPQVDLGATSTIPNAPDGNYSVTVTNTVTGCSFTQGQNLILDQTLSFPNIINLIKTDPVDCNASGRIEVIAIEVAGVAVPVANFTYEWYAGSIDPANLIPITTPNLENQLPGKYFVTARELNTKCESLAKEIDILPDNIIFPTVVIIENQPQSSCDVATPNGELSATVDGGNDDTNPNYLFTWYFGPVVNGANLIPNGNASILQNVPDGEYTVDVLNILTGCSMTSTFFVADASELLRLQVSVAVSPVTLCTIDNGVLEARVINHPDLGNFQFDWTGPGGFTATGALINNVSPGTYTVSVIDITSNFCPALPVDGIITDDRVTPPIIIREDNPLTNCDITKLNGQLSASVDGKVGGYDFEWYNGPTATGPIMHTANVYSQLDIGTYTVLVRDQITQCTNTMSADITDGTVTPPTPTAIVLNNLNDCVDPDGEVTANVSGSILGYSFDWYDGSTVTPSPDETKPGYTDLDLGNYTVTATDLVTGCTSEPATVPITDERVYAEFEYTTLPANCETSNGAIELVFLDAYEIKEVTWFDATNGVELDRATNLYNYPSGDYEVTVTTFFGCETDGQASIGTEITNYNGISANGDGQNDDFQIDCITLFPNNNVKVFNRSGILVYQADNYNNADIVFRGIGENGFYLIGEDLPDGTYFYIIDKGDGSRPTTGYLELMR